MSSTGTITSTGIGSGLDIEALVTKLMDVERAPITLLQSQESSYETKLTAWGSVKSALSTLEDAADALRTSSSVLTYSATVANSSVATATGSSSATAGTHSLSISQLAEAQKLKSDAYTSKSDTISDGTLTITLADGTTTSITIDSTNDTLSGVVSAINDADAGVTASIAYSGSSYYLVITGDDTGSSNSFTLSGIDELAYDSSSSSNSMTAVQDAQDAVFTVDGIEYTRSSNTVSDVIDGVTLSLTGTTSSDTTITVAASADDLKDKISTFIDAYNAVVELITTDTAYDADSGEAGDLNGETTLSRIKNQLRNALAATYSASSLSNLSSIGIDVALDGTMSISDESTLTSAISSSAEEVAKLFAGQGTSNGVADAIYSSIYSYLGTDGSVSNRIDAINESIDRIDSKISRLEDRMDIIEAMYRAKFTALDTLISSLNATSSYLTTALNSLSSSSS